MNIKRIELIGKAVSLSAMPDSDGVYACGDIHIKLSADCRLTVSADATPISFIKIHFENDSFTSGAKMLSGAWERGYGDMGWHPVDKSRNLPWFFCARDGDKLVCFGVETQPNALCHWNVSDDEVILTMDIRTGTEPLQLGGRTLELCRVIDAEYTDDIFESVHKFLKLLCPRPRLPKRPIYGGNDWYCNYGDNSFDKILKHTENIVSCAPSGQYKPYMVIDEGWEMYTGRPANSGPWICNDKFGDMKKMAEAIESAGAIPGIWLRPLTTVENIPMEHRLRTDREEITLDPSSPLVLEMVEKDIKRIVSWGYKLIKHDFSTWDIFGNWGKNFPDIKEINFFDKTKTTAEIINNFYNVIRKAAGEDVLIIGCNTLTHLSAGVFDIQRTGDDTSGVEWATTRKMGINTLAFSLPQHKAFYAIDADCVGITDKIPWEINKKWLDVLSKSGTPLFVSIDEASFDDEVKNDISDAFKRAAENSMVSKPLDWQENILPNKWLSTYGEDVYEW